MSLELQSHSATELLSYKATNLQTYRVWDWKPPLLQFLNEGKFFQCNSREKVGRWMSEETRLLVFFRLCDRNGRTRLCFGRLRSESAFVKFWLMESSWFIQIKCFNCPWSINLSLSNMIEVKTKGLWIRDLHYRLIPWIVNLLSNCPRCHDLSYTWGPYSQK